MRTKTHKLSIKLAAAGLLTAATVIAVPAAFADDHGRGPDRGHVESHGNTHSNGHDNRGNSDRGNVRHDDGRNDRGRTQTRVVHDTRVVYRDSHPAFYRGHTIPASYRREIRPVPTQYRAYVPAVPRGYAVGYYQGYTVVYDPATYLIASVVNLLAYH
ncbi:hypothetical protein [Solimonas marina]|uniref:RcnB family protein n=1 Tax=Solimonas marina TaxID=2714601 RepID=A0A969W4W7_9GAMM|nr:hypothetical protein [Solimonas marina]NKF20741.1 hypothetical protein [Solimonas marina]